MKKSQAGDKSIVSLSDSSMIDSRVEDISSQSQKNNQA